MTDQHLLAPTSPPIDSPAIRRVATEPDRDACMRIRMAVFVDEQGVTPEEEIDGIDDQCIHYIAMQGDRPIATARIIPKSSIAKIGRVAVVREMRGRGVGRDLMRFVLADAGALGFTEAVLDSQTYAIPFYEGVGFTAEGDEFLDAGIPHYRMRRSLDGREPAI